MNKYLIKLPKKYENIIHFIELEEDGYFIYTKTGYCIMDEGLHVIAVDKKSEILPMIRTFTKTCSCKDCREGKQLWIM